MKYRLQENMINDLTGKPCQVIEIKARTDLPKGITPSSEVVIVKNEDGTMEQVFPWELSPIRR